MTGDRNYTGAAGKIPDHWRFNCFLKKDTKGALHRVGFPIAQHFHLVTTSKASAMYPLAFQCLLNDFRHSTRSIPSSHQCLISPHHAKFCLELPAKRCAHVGEVLHPLPNHQCASPQKAPIGTFDVPDSRFHHVNIDLVGPHSPLRGHRFLLTCEDRFTR